MGGAAAELLIDSTTVGTYADSGGAVSVTVGSAIPSGAVVVAIGAVDYQGSGNASTVTSSNLTFTNRTSTDYATNYRPFIFTAVAGSLISSGEVITHAMGGTGRAANMVIMVFTGANTSTFNVATPVTNAGSSAHSITMTASGSSSYVLAVVANLLCTETPDANSTEIADAFHASRFNGFWVGRNTSKGTGSITVAATANQTFAWAAVAMEVQTA